MIESSDDMKENLRLIAEEKVKSQEQNEVIDIESLTSEQILEIIHNLKVHQIELELQNDELRITQMALDIARVRYFDLFDLAPVGYLTIYANSSIKECNLTASTILGYSRNEIKGKLISHFILSSHQDIYYLQSKKLVQTLDPCSFEIQMKRKDGAEIWLRLMMAISSPENDEKVFRVAFIDITELKKAEFEKEQLNERITKNKMQKLESLGLIAGGIAHDFNNLLSGIFCNIEMSIAKNKDKNIEKYLVNSFSTINRARALTQKLLTFSKGGSPVKEARNLFPFIRETALFALSGANVSCQFQIQENLWACNFDKNQIGQVIDNLVINARQSMPDGGNITISAFNLTLQADEHKYLSAGNYVKISISDQGPGIPEELQTEIFDPYYTTKPMGHGLGLSICYSIVKRHGGYIDVESEQGMGSTFNIFLPASIESVSASSIEPGADHKGAGTFLIMDDEDVINQALKEVMESFGYQVVAKENGLGILNVFRKELNSNRKIKGMILDLTIPGGMGGLETISEIRKLDPDIPVFISSGYSEDPVMSNPEKYGFTASLNKPFKIKELTEILETYLNK